MTREEAIEKLELLRQKVDEETYRALIMGIKALEQNERAEEWYKLFVEKLSQELCDDAISREAVKKWVCKTCPDDAECQRDCDVIKGIDALPSVTQKSGKWTLMYEPKNMVVCSECGKCAYMYQDKTSAFCPNCGAKMESEE